MTWARLDDHTYDNLKVRRAGTHAIVLWYSALTWSARHVTDGTIPKSLLADVWRPIDEDFDCERAASALVEVGLWEDRGDAYAIHDFLEYNPSKAELAERREKEREKKRRQRAATRLDGCPPGTPQGTDLGTCPPGTPQGTDLGTCPPGTGSRDSSVIPARAASVVCPPAPTRPVPTPERETRAPAKAGRFVTAPSSLSGLPDPWEEFDDGVSSEVFAWRMFKRAGRDAFNVALTPSSPHGAEYRETQKLERYALELAHRRSRAQGQPVEAEFVYVLDMVLQRFADDVGQSKRTRSPKPWKVAFVVSGFGEYAAGLEPKERAA